MIMKKFIDRKDELKSLEEMLDKKGSGIIVIYGRRRVGKTRLVLEAIKRRKNFYYLATETRNIDGFARLLTERFPEFSRYKKDWEILIEKLENKVDVLVLDEFPYIIQEDKGIISMLQRLVDTRLKKMKIILTGSTISTMASKVLAYKSPLYGRRIGDIKLKQMSFFDAIEFFPGEDAKKLVEIYGFADGIPFYLERISGDFWEWLDKELKNPGSFIKNEGDFLLKYEFEETAVYKAILEAIANGKTRRKEILDYVGVKGDIGQYLKNLIELGFVHREVPVTENKIRTKRGRYYLSDNFLKFWFRFIQPNMSYIEMKVFGAKDIKKNYNQYLGSVFEEIGREYLLKKIRKGEVEKMKVGRWWHKDKEIDVVGIGKNLAIFGEAKWRDNIDAYKIARSLEDKVKYIKWVGDYELWIFGKSFRRRLNEINGVKVKCIDINEMINYK